jgi:hypothetical protein
MATPAAASVQAIKVRFSDMKNAPGLKGIQGVHHEHRNPAV